LHVVERRNAGVGVVAAQVEFAAAVFYQAFRAGKRDVDVVVAAVAVVGGDGWRGAGAGGESQGFGA
jgi:hypothetical protein